MTSTIAAAATGDFIVNVGDNNHGIAGLASWAPLATSKGTFAGVNRDLSPRKLAGLYVDASALSLTVDAGVSRALNTMKANEGNCTHVFMNPIDYEALCQTGSTQVVAEAGEEREFGFKAVSFVSDGSKARVIEDATFPAGQAWLVNMANIEYVYAGSEIDYLDQDGQTWLRVGGSDSYEMRIGAYPAGLAVKNPGRSLCVVKLY